MSESLFSVKNDNKNRNSSAAVVTGTLTLCMLGLSFVWFLVVCGFLFLKLTFSKKVFQEYHQNVKQFASRLILFSLIWVQTVCKGYQQATKFAHHENTPIYF